MTQVCVLGAGAWGTALAKVLAEKGNPTRVWAYEEDVARSIAEAHENTRYLPGHVLPDTLTATTDLKQALGGAELVLVVVPTHAMREVLEKAKPLIPEKAILCSASKGIENDSLMLMSEVFVDVLGKELEPRLTYLSGPSFAKEVALGMPTAVVVAGKDPTNTEIVQRAFASEKLRVYSSDDVVGVEVGGAMKNVIAIAAGVIDGLGFGHNSRAGMITRGLFEIGQLANKLGGHPLTVAGLSGMGDLVLTCTGDLSRNRTVGVELGQGKKLPEILAGLGHVAEGVKTAKSAYDLSIREGVTMPITHEVYSVLYQGKDPRQAVVDIMTRELRAER
jgi:glycerol-3-phosphate dehydrogenase (NAD(P)+)